MVSQEVAANPGRHILLDGFPRTRAQADELAKTLTIDRALNLAVPFEEIVTRISQRWTHPGSGRVYAYDYNPPKVEGLDDVTGEPLVQRADDKPDAVRTRLEAYQEMTAPLVAFYDAAGVLKEFDGSNRADLVEAGRRSDAIYEALKPEMNKLHSKE
jgi:adenylate kinase family enzyme